MISPPIPDLLPPTSHPAALEAQGVRVICVATIDTRPGTSGAFPMQGRLHRCESMRASVLTHCAIKYSSTRARAAAPHVHARSTLPPVHDRAAAHIHARVEAHQVHVQAAVGRRNLCPWGAAAAPGSTGSLSVMAHILGRWVVPETAGHLRPRRPAGRVGSRQVLRRMGHCNRQGPSLRAPEHLSADPLEPAASASAFRIAGSASHNASVASPPASAAVCIPW
mmetsp:Transcript_67725/g.144918  ORF Transcript_67725/g.144918 Transcript_67725/m.144918 type:complete len:223 (-) Transcript_67725:393-1061(-)